MSTIAEEIQRLKQAKSSIKTSIQNKGVTVSDTATLDAYPALIDSIQTGGGTGESTFQEKTVSITANTTTEIVPDNGYNGMTKVTVTTKVKPAIYDGTRLGNSTFQTIPDYDFSQIQNADYLFNGCNHLTGLTRNLDCTNMVIGTGMFMSCHNLESTTSFQPSSPLASPRLKNTGNMIKMDKMFAYCDNLIGVSGPSLVISVQHLATDACTTMRSMFYQDIMLRAVPQFTSTSNVTDMGFMFWGCNDFDAFDCNYDMSKVTDIEGMFTNSTIISFTRNNGPLDFSSVTNATDAFKGCTNLTTLAGFTGLKASLSLSDCPLTVESINNVINEMYDFTRNGVTPSSGQGTLTLGTTNLAKLSDEEKAVATSKGWTLA